MINLDKLPNRVALDIQDHLWDHNELRQNLTTAQIPLVRSALLGQKGMAKRAILKQMKKDLGQYLAPSSADQDKTLAPQDFCAKQVTPPHHPLNK